MKQCTCFFRDLRCFKYLVLRKKSSPTYTVFRVPFFGLCPGNQLDPWPDSAGVLPTTAAPTNPFSENGSGCHNPPVVFVQATLQVGHLSGCSHANGDKRAQQVGRDSKSRTFRYVVDLAHQFQPKSRTDEFGQEVAYGLSTTFKAWGDNARGNQRGFK